MIEVEGPDGTVIEFPEGTPPETIKSVMAKQYPSTVTKRVAQLPDGETLEIEVPEGADDATVERIGQEALNARKVRGRAVAGKPVQAPAQQPGFGETLLNSMGDVGTNMLRGAATLPDLAAQAGGMVSGGIGSALDFMATGGGASPQNAQAIPDRPGFSMRGALDQFNPEARNSPTAFASQLFGSLVVPLGPKAAPARPSAPVASAPVKEASGKMVPYADEIVAAGKRENVPVMTTDVIPPRTMMGKAARNIGERIPIVGTAGQQQARMDAATRLIEDFGGVGADDAVNAVSADLVKTRGAELSKWTGRKKQIIDNIPGIAPATKALAAIDQQIAELTARGSPTALAVVEKLKELRPSFQGKTLKQLEAMRADELSDVFKGDGLANIKTVGEKALRAIYGPLNDDMGAHIATHAGKPAQAQWKGANERLAAMVGQLKASAFKKTLNAAETTPEGAAQLIFSKTPSEINRLVGNLSPAGKDKARSAVMFEAAKKSTDNGIVSPARFATALQAMQASTRGLFSPADAARIDGMVKLLKGTQRAADAGVMTNSGMQLAPYAVGAGAISAPVATVTAGLLARLYESAPTRDLLLRLGRAKPGTEGYKISFQRLNTAIAKMTPAAANDVEGAVALSPSRAAAQDERD